MSMRTPLDEVIVNFNGAFGVAAVAERMERNVRKDVRLSHKVLKEVEDLRYQK